MKLGILGGSFDPVHLGHLFAAEKAYTALGLDRVIFIPAFRSPFKIDKTEHIFNHESHTKDRIDMTAAAIRGDYRYALDNCEIKKEGISYTIHTIEDIIARYRPSCKPVLIIGDDLAPEFTKWRDYEKILELAEVAVVRRNNEAPVDYPFPRIQLENETLDISSSKVRHKIKENSDWHSLVPQGVRALIEDRKLYGFDDTPKEKYSGASDDCGLENILRIEETARQILSAERFLHSRNTALAAVDLCRRFNIDPKAGYLAGIAHDLAKQMEGKHILKILKSGKHEYEVSSIEKGRPNLLHGKAAAILLRDRFFINNIEVLEAVAYHTFGSDKMGLLAKIVYIADKTEVTRNIDPALRQLCANGTDLDKILFAVLEKTIVKLKAKELNLSKETLLLLNKIKN
ncbi:MAG: nicotinate (nicotinamide) nucleotide adenylyltransferase [Treponema sp.]|nr:nicotinate (nicotinamide) nucleotide adenylyltransferase [Treponema sp.]